MRLPHHLVSAPLFLFEDPNQLIQALGARVNAAQIDEILALTDLGLPPVVSQEALATMIGVNSGLIWSLVNRPMKHYRVFEIPKGQGVRTITAPKVVLKTVQKWLSVHFSKSYVPSHHVYGFVSGKSHIDAAMAHVSATWAYSADLRHFFESTPELAVVDALRHLGYGEQSSRLVAKLCCFHGSLAQGAPTSPTLSNVCFRLMDDSLLQLAEKYNCKVTRYADDIVFSGNGEFSTDLQAELHERLALTPWKIAQGKESTQPIKGRIKVHGLLIKQDGVRLTKGYRNQVRAFAHILATRNTAADNYHKLIGHIEYARHVHHTTGSPTGISSTSEEVIDEQKKQALLARKATRLSRGNIVQRLKRFIGL